MVETEVALLVEKALATDSEICVRHLGLDWDRPVMPFRELPGSIRPERQTDTDPRPQVAQTEKDKSDRASSAAESTVVDKEGSDAELEEETLARVSELLCDATVRDNRRGLVCCKQTLYYIILIYFLSVS